MSADGQTGLKQGTSREAIVLCPMRIERAHVERVLHRRGLTHVHVVQTGIGRERVLAAVERIWQDGRAVRGHAPAARHGNAEPGLAPGPLLVLAGACGGLVETEPSPPIARVIDEHGKKWVPFDADPEGVVLVAVDRIVSTPADKRELAQATGASIVDMESHAFAQRCSELGLAWSVVRGVSDTPEETLPGEVMGWITPDGDTRGGRAMLDMVRRPGLVPHIVGVVRRSNRVLPLVGERVAKIVRDWQGLPALEGA